MATLDNAGLRRFDCGIRNFLPYCQSEHIFLERGSPKKENKQTDRPPDANKGHNKPRGGLVRPWNPNLFPPFVAPARAPLTETTFAIIEPQRSLFCPFFFLHL